MTIVLRGPYKDPSSHAGTVRNLAVALHKAGVPVRLADCPSGLWTGYVLKERTDVVATLKQLAETPITPGDYTLIQHVVPNQFIYDPAARRNIGYMTFETDGVPAPWLVPMQAMDQIWCASFQNMQAFRRGGCRRELVYVPHGIDPTIYNTDPATDFTVDLPFGVTRFGCCFDWTPRKNGLMIIEAFFEAFRGRDDVMLLMKTYIKGGTTEPLKRAIAQIREQMRVGEYPKVMLLPDVIPEWTMGSFYKQLDCFVSAAHGEGFGKCLMEAMACGIPCITTGWGGHMDFCNADNSMFIADAPLGPVSDEQIQQCGSIYANQLWAYPNFGDLVYNMRWFAANRDSDVVANMRRAALDTAQRFTWNAVAGHIKELLYGSN